jgi:AcrR family transcriptional regulator
MTETQSRRGRPPGSDGVETRRRILRGARTVFSNTGFDRATMEEIAREAGLTRNAIANYYPSKIELHRAAFRSIQQDALVEIMSNLPDADRPTAERIFGLFESAIRVNDSDSTFVRFWVTSTLDAARHTGLREGSQRQFAQVRQYFVDCLEQGRGRGEIDAAVVPDDLAQVLVDLLWGLAMDSGFHSTPERVKRVLTALNLLLSSSLSSSRRARHVEGGQRTVTGNDRSPRTTKPGV